MEELNDSAEDPLPQPNMIAADTSSLLTATGTATLTNKTINISNKTLAGTLATDGALAITAGGAGTQAISQLIQELTIK